MSGKSNNSILKTSYLKNLRLQILQLHKLLIDEERAEFEGHNGKITSGQFLNLLLNEPNFQWLRNFSTIIVEIDEMFDLKDGFTGEMVEKHLLQIRRLINLELDDDVFRSKYKSFIQTNSEIAVKHSEIKNLLLER